VTSVIRAALAWLLDAADKRLARPRGSTSSDRRGLHRQPARTAAGPRRLEVVKVAPPHSLVFVMGERIAEIPDVVGPVAATASCVTIGTLMELDGETEIRLSGPHDFKRTDDLALAWSGTIASSGVVQVQTSAGTTLLSMPWHGADHPVVRIWTNDENEPDLIWVVVEGHDTQLGGSWKFFPRIQ
jgi:hypothetical protein